MFEVTIDTITMDTSRRICVDADARSLVLRYTVILDGDVRWLGDTDAASFVAIDTVVPYKQPFVATEVDSMTSVIIYCIVIYGGIVLVRSGS
jgi:hypothetical protein